MTSDTIQQSGGEPKGGQSFLNLAQDILSYSNRGAPRIPFLREVSRMLLEFSGCDAMELRHRHGEITYRWKSSRHLEDAFEFELLPDAEDVAVALTAGENSLLDRLCKMVISGAFDPNHPSFTSGGSFRMNEPDDLPESLRQGDDKASLLKSDEGKACRSLALIPFKLSPENIGVLIFKCGRPDHFASDVIESYEGIARTFGLAAADRNAQHMVRERVKELTCLYGIAQIAENTELPREQKLRRIVGLLPSAWQYPDIAVARIDMDSHTYLTPGYRDGRYRQTADIVIKGKKRGLVEVAYVEGKPELLEGPFLREETSLILEVARQVAAIVEREETETDRLMLQEQLRHADRLATIGQLTAAMAHELNEPLSSVLGFAQLAKKNLADAPQVESDLGKIVNISLYARDIIRKLLTFARPMPTQKREIDMNAVVTEALSLFESRCHKEGIKLIRRLSDTPPIIEADPVQLNQLLINMVVNAIQAMPNGGTLTVQTVCEGESLLLTIEDTGVGMNAETKRQIFNPFFTTKDVQHGTGIGLSVVQGIVTSYGGSIEVKSREGKGSRFEIRLPLTKKDEPAQGAENVHSGP
jgi:two-component system NtrC family sensor kinase